MAEKYVCNFVEDALFPEERIYVGADVDDIYRGGSYPEARDLAALAQVVR
ncbi:MAG: hypothetical protein U5N21_14850 [Rhodococcus sp. (in: high G+C Gram-positive bacteria)]|nr:hypothetical protein [Rhodococcus sp. (in: high G+C Gram-positive bacteria)]